MNIWVAASDGLTETVEKLLQQQPGLTANSKDPNGYTAVHGAASYGHVDLLRLLVNKYHGDINVRDNDGDTPLHHTEDVATAKVIIEELNADFQATNNEGKTPLDVFEEDQESIELIQYMKEKCGLPLNQDSLGIDAEQLAQFKDNLRYTLEHESDDDQDPENIKRREKLEQILQSDNAEQELENYIRDLVRNQIFGAEHDDSAKKRR